jgi:hypothetical protein
VRAESSHLMHFPASNVHSEVIGPVRTSVAANVRISRETLVRCLSVERNRYQYVRANCQVEKNQPPWPLSTAARRRFNYEFSLIT